MRRILWMAAMIACVAMMLAGCGVGLKSADTVVRDLDKAVTGLESYKGAGTMTLHTGAQPLEYRVEVWYQKPQYYRIALTNAKKDITQIVLRNDEGVFVLTPSLNKSFRFQSDWPQNQGQVYLYQTLAQSILIDNSRKFTTDKDAYVFDVMANYQNGSLARQKIWLDKKTLAPQRVEVSDSNATVMVDVTFDSFSFGDKFKDGDFDTAANLGVPKDDGGANGGAASPGGEAGKPSSDGTAGGDGKSDPGAESGSAGEGTEDGADGAAGGDPAAGESPEAGGPASGSGDDGAAGGDAAAGESPEADGRASGSGDGAAAGGDAAAGESPEADGPASGSGDDGAAGDDAADSAGAGDSGQAAAADPGNGGGREAEPAFAAMEPSYLPDGTALKDMEEIKLGGSRGVILRYAGDYDFSLIQSHPKDRAVSLVRGDLVDLGFTVALLTGDAQKTLTWTYGGVEYRLTSGNMDEREMIKVAQSVEAELGK